MSKLRNLRLMAVLTVMVTAMAMLVTGGNAVAQEKKLVFAVPGIPPVFGSVIAFLAEKDGLFKKYGVDVTVRPFDTGAAAARAVAAGDIDLALSPSPLIVNQISNADVKLVAIYGLEYPDWLIGSTDPKLAKCQDLSGQPVGVDSVGGARSIALKEMIVPCGIKIENVQQVSLGTNVGAAMVAGQLKFGVLHIDDVPSIETQTGKPITVITTLKEVNPVSHYLLLVTRSDKLAQNRDALVRLLAGLIDAGSYMRDPKNVDRVAEIATVTGRSQTEAKPALKKYLDMEFWPNGHAGLTRKNLESVTKTQVAIGGIKPDKTPVTYERLTDPTLWRDAAAMAKSR